MSAPTSTSLFHTRPRRSRLPAGHIHLPSVHIRKSEHEDTGFDYEEDLFVDGVGRRFTVHRVTRLALIAAGEIVRERHTREQLCDGDVEALNQILPELMDEDDPDVAAAMQERARLEYQRQLRIQAGFESACAGCGCSETRSCSGGCVWATTAFCSRCI